jgi:anion-transporting  ArsA/GET3 family ATPase
MTQPPAPSSQPPTIDGLLRQRLVVCLGNGGVGKTTVAATLAVRAASAGRRTAVITVDPARRLKDALGLEELSVDPHRVPLKSSSGSLDALAIDTKRVFDALIDRVAPSADVAERIRANRLYRELSNELGGSTEYMAMEKLYELLHRESYDLVVVDTPPSAHARDLLSAPRRMSELVASSAVRILKTPASLLWGTESGLAKLTLNALLKALERWTGLSVLKDLAEFVGNFEQLAEGFRVRAEEVQRTLKREDTSFLLVTSPEPDTIDSTIEFHRELRADGFPVAGAVANRVLDFAPLGPAAGGQFPPALRRKLLQNYTDYRARSERDRHQLNRLAAEAGARLIASLPELADNAASLQGLEMLARLLASIPSAGPAGQGRQESQVRSREPRPSKLKPPK